jgi:hypothetical protein
MAILTREFYNGDTVEIARALLVPDLIEHDAVLDLTDNHTSTSKSFRISAMRMYLPLSTCLK